MEMAIKAFSLGIYAHKTACGSCHAPSAEFCLRHRCPYYAIQNYTKEQREYGAIVIAEANRIALTKKG